MDPRQQQLMFAVLDGEGTPDEIRELERLVGGDLEARAEYEAFRNLFTKLQSISTLDPPPGLAERVQHFRPSAKGRTMTRNKRTLLIGIATAAAAGVIAGYFLVDFPAGRQNVSGTVVPAQRYRAEQIKAADVKLGDPAIAQLMQSESFERIIKDPKLRTLALDPGFQALARDPQALSAMMRNVDAFVTLAKSSSAMDVLARSAATASQARAAATATQARVDAAATNARVDAAATNARVDAAATNARVDAAATNARVDAAAIQAMSVDAMNSLSRIAEARPALALAPEAVQILATSSAAVQVLAQRVDAIALMARDAGLASMAMSPAFSNALATYASSVNATSTSAMEK
jgi:hypothetical protein